MRVIAGTVKGRSLMAPPRRGVRPTSERVREALFSIVGFRIGGARVLDLYAGTGAIGIEALSRGAQHAVFVESQPPALRVLRANLTRCGLSACAEVYAMPVARFLGAPTIAGGPYDVVFADPPYRKEGIAALLQALESRGTVTPHSLVILEHATKTLVPAATGDFTCLRQYRYGDSTLSVFALRAERS